MPTGRSRRQRLALLALAVVVAVIHLGLLDRHLPDRLGEGAADSRPRRMEVAFVRELAPAAPLPVAAAPALRRMAAAPPTPAASAAALTPLAQAEATPPIALPALGPLADLMPPVAASAAPPTAEAASFEWPPSTRLSYTLRGDYRGPVEGQAQVEWLRTGTRYQVHLDVSVGPAFAPLISRRISSEGEITPEGLRPRRYDEETRLALRAPRRLTIWLDADRVRLPGGTELVRPAGVQDSASQFVQMTWLFTTQPEWLQSGRTITMPLALPRRVEPWLYDVLETVTLQTPAGEVQAVHIKPRRSGRAGGDLTAEFWVAPSLQYLPVRILIRQDEASYIDMLIERLPEQAERPR